MIEIGLGLSALVIIAWIYTEVRQQRVILRIALGLAAFLLGTGGIATEFLGHSITNSKRQAAQSSAVHELRRLADEAEYERLTRALQIYDDDIRRHLGLETESGLFKYVQESESPRK